jgi:hypothetical protein
MVRQDRVEVVVHRGTADVRRSHVPTDELTMPELGLTCPVQDVYRDTLLG